VLDHDARLRRRTVVALLLLREFAAARLFEADGEGVLWVAFVHAPIALVQPCRLRRLQRLDHRALIQKLQIARGARHARAECLHHSLHRDPYAWPSTIMRLRPVLLGVGLCAALVLAWCHGEKGQQRISVPEVMDFQDSRLGLHRPPEVLRRQRSPRVSVLMTIRALEGMQAPRSLWFSTPGRASSGMTFPPDQTGFRVS
jgi:hypothetical protein